MDLHSYFMVMVEVLLCASSVTSQGAGDGFPYPDFHDFHPRTLTPSDFRDFAYTEVMTPYYHYYFYAPAFKSSEALGETNLEGYLPHTTWNRDNSFIPQSFMENEYYSPEINDVGYRIQEPAQRPFKNYFVQKPHTTFNPEGRYPSKVPSDVVPLFLPTALMSGTSNIIRKEDQGRTLNTGNVYAPSFKDHKPHVFEPNQIRKPSLAPSLFSFSNPNIIRGEVPSINKLFKPSSSTSSNQFSGGYTTPSSTFSFTTQTPIDRDGPYNTFVSVSSSPTSFQPPLTSTTIQFPEYSSDETLAPIFAPSSNPLETFTTPVPPFSESPSFRQGSSIVPPETTPVVFEAPGHTHPKR